MIDLDKMRLFLPPDPTEACTPCGPDGTGMLRDGSRHIDEPDSAKAAWQRVTLRWAAHHARPDHDLWCARAAGACEVLIERMSRVPSGMGCRPGVAAGQEITEAGPTGYRLLMQAGNSGVRRPHTTDVPRQRAQRLRYGGLP